MLYNTICQRLLEDRKDMYEQLRSRRLLPTTRDRLSSELKSRHEAWKERLSKKWPDSSPSQIASEALEIALKELEDSLPPASPPDEDEARSFLDAAMAFLHRHTSAA